MKRRKKAETGLVPISPSAIYNGKHHLRYIDRLKGLTLEQIAEKHSCTVRAVEMSIRSVEKYKESVSLPALQETAIAALMPLIPEANLTISRAVNAQHQIMRYDANGDQVHIMADDHETQLNAF